MTSFGYALDLAKSATNAMVFTADHFHSFSLLLMRDTMKLLLGGGI